MTVAPVSSAAELQRLAALAAYDVLDLKPDDPHVADLTNVCELAATRARSSRGLNGLVR